jgi:L-cysteine desulfidase
LSAFCGALSAAAGAGAGIAFLRSGDRRIIAESINNTLSNLTGVICDGAKASCALKISSCLESSFFAAELAMAGNAISDRTGVIFGDVDETIAAIGRVGANGMKETDRVILGIMTN